MRKFQAKTVDFEIIKSNGADYIPYNFLRSDDGDMEMLCVSPLHGRSFVVARNEQGRYVASKGSGLSYTSHCFLNTIEMGVESWGLLIESAAVRDFEIGIEIQKLGIKTNEMEYVLKLKDPIQFQNQEIVEPFLLQYNVECPYRICDAAFMEEKEIACETKQWEKLNHHGFTEKYMIAADVLINNLHIMHSSNILHNAIHIQNYTWALELLDFELARTLNVLYSEEDEKHFPVLYHREIIQTYEVINYIAWVLREDISYTKIDSLFKEYEFDLEQYKQQRRYL
jgi:hypothetical protein